VCINILDDNFELKETAKAALRWGAILFVEFRNISSNQFPYSGRCLSQHSEPPEFNNSY
jgi:hypothetical protein